MNGWMWLDKWNSFLTAACHKMLKAFLRSFFNCVLMLFSMQQSGYNFSFEIVFYCRSLFGCVSVCRSAASASAIAILLKMKMINSNEFIHFGNLFHFNVLCICVCFFFFIHQLFCYEILWLLRFCNWQTSFGENDESY